MRNREIVKIVGIIPARFKSSRFEGKPLVDIKGRPMIWWVYNQVKQISEFDAVYVATDDTRIVDSCDKFGIPTIMTSDQHSTHVHRVHEVSDKIQSDFYVVVCGDEPLISVDVIRKCLPSETLDEMYVGGLCRYFSDPAEVMDPSNIKIVTNEKDECILLSRSPVPFPYKTVTFKYKKIVGVECYNKQALDFFVSTPKGYLENIEDVTLQRFLENKIHIKYRLVTSDAISVDTPADLQKVLNILEQRNISYE